MKPKREGPVERTDVYVPSTIVSEVPRMDRSLFHWLKEHQREWAGWPTLDPLEDMIEIKKREAILRAICCPHWRVLGLDAVDHHIARIRAARRRRYITSVERNL